MPPIRVGVYGVVLRDDAMLLAEFHDESGHHYNLPGGGVEPEQSVHAALHREMHEETDASVEVGRLLLVWEYYPPDYSYQYGPDHKLGLVFQCMLQPGTEPSLPESPDPNQIGVRWVPLGDLPDTPLLPRIGKHLVTALQNPSSPGPLYVNLW